MILKYPLLLVILFLFLIANCGSPIPYESAEEGSITFKVEWKDAPTLPSDPELPLMSPSLDCTAAGVFDVQMVVYDSNKRRVSSSERLSCSAHSGAITNVPAGSNLTLVFLGSDSGNIRYRGEVPDITVTANQTTDVGTITAYSFVSTAISPANNSTASSRTVTFSWASAPGASSYLIHIYNSDGTIDQTDTTATSFTTTFPTSGQFYWLVSARDAYGNSGSAGTKTGFSNNWILNVP